MIGERAKTSHELGVERRLWIAKTEPKAPRKIAPKGRPLHLAILSNKEMNRTVTFCLFALRHNRKCRPGTRRVEGEHKQEQQRPEQQQNQP